MQRFIDWLEDINFEQTLTDEEMRRVIRFLLAFEEETFQLYTRLLVSTDNARVESIFKDIADERRFQITQLIRLLGDLGAGEELLH
jgi:rubrerythrin